MTIRETLAFGTFDGKYGTSPIAKSKEREVVLRVAGQGRIGRMPEMEKDRNELPQLTAKQMAFVHALLEGKTASDAYRAAYDCSKMTDHTLWSEASRLRANPKVSAWLRHFQRISMDGARLTLEAHLAELARGRETALALGQVSAAVQAEHYRGKAVGLYEDRLSVTASISDEDLVKAIEALMGQEIAKAIGTGLGVWQEGPNEIPRD